MQHDASRLTICVALSMLSAIAVAGGSVGQSPQSVYPKAAPLSEYLIKDRDAEIALARSAAPSAISGEATILVLGLHGYVPAV